MFDVMILEQCNKTLGFVSLLRIIFPQLKCTMEVFTVNCYHTWLGIDSFVTMQISSKVVLSSNSHIVC